MIAAILLILTAILSFGIYQKKTNAKCESKNRLDGKTALVTGGTAGMGLEIAKELAKRGTRVIVACPYPEEGQSALKHIITSTGNRNIEFRNLDLASLESTRRFAADILANEPRLDLLVNNAGVIGPTTKITEDQINFVMQVNYFGLFLLTQLLLPLLKKTGQKGGNSRIVNIASVLHRVGTVDINFSCKKYTVIDYEYYCDSKFCVVLFTRELAKRLRGENVVVNSVDPGAVGTGIFIYAGCNKILGNISKWTHFCFFKTPKEGAQTALYVALEDCTGDVSGKFFKNCRMARAVSRAYDDKLATKVWEESLRIVKLS